MRCEFIDACPFFKTLDSEAVTALKEVYCHANPAICARRQVAMAVGTENVPPYLNPNHSHLVRETIELAKSRM